jgi:hypothetical protein
MVSCAARRGMSRPPWNLGEASLTDYTISTDNDRQVEHSWARWLWHVRRPVRWAFASVPGRCHGLTKAQASSSPGTCSRSATRKGRSPSPARMRIRRELVTDTPKPLAPTLTPGSLVSSSQ